MNAGVESVHESSVRREALKPLPASMAHTSLVPSVNVKATRLPSAEIPGCWSSTQAAPDVPLVRLSTSPVPNDRAITNDSPLT